MTRVADAEQVAALLGEVFPEGPHLADPRYLRWLYEDSPFGPVIQQDRFDDQGLSAHYALVPADLELDGKAVSAAISLNTAVHERARGGGAFVALARDTIDHARGAGIDLIVGVANANSTPGFERRLDFINRGPLPVTVMLPTPGRSNIESAWSDEPAADVLLNGIASLLAPSPEGLQRTWTEASLRWRLASPGRRYGVHRNGGLLAVTATTSGPARTQVAVILGIFAARAVERTALRALVRSVCRFHRAPLALHAGINDRAALRGIRLPERMRPSPLNLIARSLSDAPVSPASRFEFIDFDAY